MTQELADIPTGLHDIGWDDYRAMPHMNGSTLDWGTVSMRHLKSAIDGKLGKRDTDSLTFGRALHMMILEPSLYEERWAVCEQCEGMTGKGVRCSKRGTDRYLNRWYCSQHAPQAKPDDIEVLTLAELDRLTDAVNAVKSHRVSGLLGCSGRYEVTAVANLCGVACKGRIDKLVPAQRGRPQVIVDLKTMAPPTSPGRGRDWTHQIARQLIEYAYPMKAALYCDLVEAATGQPCRMAWCFIESDQPFDVVVVWADDQWLDVGRVQYRELLARVVACRKSGVWPGRSEAATTIDAPEWWVKRYADQIDMQRLAESPEPQPARSAPETLEEAFR